nr:MAG TPA: hypothetical protein [Caudoviricetes sp.]
MQETLTHAERKPNARQALTERKPSEGGRRT